MYLYTVKIRIFKSACRYFCFEDEMATKICTYKPRRLFFYNSKGTFGSVAYDTKRIEAWKLNW